jgi:hypothetical protein
MDIHGYQGISMDIQIGYLSKLQIATSVTDLSELDDWRLGFEKVHRSTPRWILLGQKIEKTAPGVHIILYDDGSREKIYSRGE